MLKANNQLIKSREERFLEAKYLSQGTEENGSSKKGLLVDVSNQLSVQMTELSEPCMVHITQLKTKVVATKKEMKADSEAQILQKQPWLNNIG